MIVDQMRGRIEGKQVVKTIYVQNKIFNIIIK